MRGGSEGTVVTDWLSLSRSQPGPLPCFRRQSSHDSADLNCNRLKLRSVTARAKPRDLIAFQVFHCRISIRGSRCDLHVDVPASPLPQAKGVEVCRLVSHSWVALMKVTSLEAQLALSTVRPKNLHLVICLRILQPSFQDQGMLL